MFSFRKKYKMSLPYILEDLSIKALEFNLMRDDDFERQYRCLAFAFNGSTLLTYGMNIMKTNPHYKNYADNFKMSTHAEISMLLNLSDYKRSLYGKVTDIVIIRGSANLLNSYPCSLCMEHLEEKLPNIRMWYYYNNIWKVKLI
jgi:hypothetical protein